MYFSDLICMTTKDEYVSKHFDALMNSYLSTNYLVQLKLKGKIIFTKFCLSILEFLKSNELGTLGLNCRKVLKIDMVSQ